MFNLLFIPVLLFAMTSNLLAAPKVDYCVYIMKHDKPDIYGDARYDAYYAKTGDIVEIIKDKGTEPSVRTNLHFVVIKIIRAPDMDFAAMKKSRKTGQLNYEYILDKQRFYVRMEDLIKEEWSVAEFLAIVYDKSTGDLIDWQSVINE